MEEGAWCLVLGSKAMDEIAAPEAYKMRALANALLTRTSEHAGLTQPMHA